MKTATKKAQRMPKGCVLPIGDLCRMVPCDHRDATAELEKEGLSPIREGNAHLYDVAKAVYILSRRKSQQKAAEELARERAEKTRVERAILERKYRPVDELREAVANLGAELNRIIEDSAMTADDQEKTAAALVALGVKQENDQDHPAREKTI